jgi:hypothetical protein
MSAQLLQDTMFINFQLVEAGDGKKVKARGEFARADLATENGRVYPRPIWEREIRRMTQAMAERKVLGELDHPSDGKTLLSRASHLLTGLELRDDGILIGEAEALDTQKGKDLQALLKSGAKIGVSSRGFGSTKPDNKGKEIVQEDYRLATFDFVADPADSTAYPETFVESKEPGMDGKDEKKLDEEIETRVQARLQEEVAQKVDSAVQEREAQLREEFSAKLPGLMGKLKSDLKEEVRGELLTDPSVAGARAALEHVKEILRPFVIPEDAEAVVRQKEAEIKRLKETVAERDLHIKGMEEEMEKLAQVAKEAGYKYYLERTIGTEPEADLIRNLIGDVGLFESADSLKEKLQSVKKQLQERRDAEEAEEKRLQEETQAREAAEQERIAKLEADREAAIAEERERAEKAREAVSEEMDQFRKDNGELLEAVEKALEANKIQSLLLYAERQLTGNPNVVKIRKILESTDLQSQDQVDEIIAENSKAPAGSTDLDSVRERVRRMSKGRGYSAREEERGDDRPPREPMNEDYNGLGIPLGRLQRMSGIG